MSGTYINARQRIFFHSIFKECLLHRIKLNIQFLLIFVSASGADLFGVDFFLFCSFVDSVLNCNTNSFRNILDLHREVNKLHAIMINGNIRTL